MKTDSRIMNWTIEIIAYLFVLLFVYAAVSKLLDFENFQVQLGQSPLVSSFAGAASFFVPFLELVLAMLLVFPKTRKLAFYISYFLMGLFTAYIYVMINYSPFIPCSCGGILEGLGWKQHLFFNLIFVFMAAIAVLLPSRHSMKRVLAYLLLLLAAGSVSIYALFQVSEKMKHQRNNFTRSFPHHPITAGNEVDLKFNSYYIAGYSAGKVYLGNYTAPLSVTELDSSLNLTKVHTIDIEDVRTKYKSLNLVVDPPNFYIWDGVEAYVYKGDTVNWKAYPYINRQAYFTSYVPISPTRGAIRAISTQTNETVLGLITVGKSIDVKLNPNILTKQVDGLFDTDGTHLYNKQYGKILYTYYYRNQYAVSDTLMEATRYGNTIDTNTRAKIKVKFVRSQRGSKLSEPAVTVNRRTATYGRFLYVHAGLLGQYEPRENWDANSIIDVYDFMDGTYRFSFYIDDKPNARLKDFRVSGDLIYVLNGNFIRTYRLKKEFY